MIGKTKYCEQCGHSLTIKKFEGTLRKACLSCGHIHFLDPKLVVVILANQNGKLLMVRRGIEPSIGEWAFPSGYVDRGETVENAAMREVKEETGLGVRLISLLGLYSQTGNPIVIAAYSAKVTGGNLKADGDAVDAKFLDPSDLPILPFPHDEQIIRDWNLFNKNTE